MNDSETNLGDVAILPASFFWNGGNWHFNLYELVTTPTGQYDVDNAVNLGRNYWSFDTVFAATNLNMENGREFSFAAGYMINRENDDTDYESGNELHVDVMLNQYFSDYFAIGLHGYYYNQIEGDSGAGAVLGDFKGESYGIGPSLLWIPKSTGGNFSVMGTWLHDLHASNRLESDYAPLRWPGRSVTRHRVAHTASRHCPWRFVMMMPTNMDIKNPGNRTPWRASARFTRLPKLTHKASSIS